MGRKEYYQFDADEGIIEPMPEQAVQKALEEAGLRVDKWKVFKQVVGAVASGCASIVINRYLKAQLPEPSSTIEKIVTGVGVYFVTGVVGSAVEKYAEQELDDWKETVMTVKDNIEDAADKERR